jgi:hypothetical protein
MASQLTSTTNSAPGLPAHVGDAAEVVLELLELVAELGDFLLRQGVDGAVLFHLLDLAHAGDGLADRLVVGQRAAEPAVDHEGLLGLGGDGLEGFLRLLLGADEEDLAAAGDGVIDELAGLLQAVEGLLEVDDVDAVLLPEDDTCASWGSSAWCGVRSADPLRAGPGC